MTLTNVPAPSTVTTSPPANATTNVTKIGGTALALGQVVMTASIPVVLASNQTAVDGNITKVGGSTLALGQTTASASIPVVLASDQTGLNVSKIGGSALALGQLTMAASIPVVLASDQTGLNISKIGGSALAIGQTTMTASIPVTLASNQSALSVNATAIASTVMNGDVGIGARATTTNAGLHSRLISAGSTNAAFVKASAGRIFGFYYTNTNAAIRVVKLFNKASAPTVGTDVPIYTIAIPALGSVSVHDVRGVFCSAGIAICTTTETTDAGTTAVGLGDIIGGLFYV